MGRAQNSRVFSGRTYRARFAAVKAFQRLQGLYRRLIRRHLDFFSVKSFSLRGTRIFFAGVRKYHYPPVSQLIDDWSKLKLIADSCIKAAERQHREGSVVS